MTEAGFASDRRVVVLTGAAGGIGATLLYHLLCHDYDVVATDLHGKPPGGPSLAFAPQLHWFPADITDEAACAGLGDFVADRFAAADVLINCAGFFPIAPFEEISVADWRRVVDINLTGPFLVTQTLLPLLKKSRAGRIINYGSSTFFKGSANQAHYISAKAGVIGLTRCLATELGPHNITCNVITPGLTLTSSVVDHFPAQRIAQRREDRPLKRDMLPDDLVGITLFLASTSSGFITGQTFNVDGGAIKH